MKRERWLRGHDRKESSIVLIGTGLHCVLCGLLMGVTSVIINVRRWPLWVWDKHKPHQYPKWPFEEKTCPMHPESDASHGTYVSEGFSEWPSGKPRPLP